MKKNIKNVKTLTVGQIFNTKNDAMSFITGCSMQNNHLVGEGYINFIQRGEASYEHNGEKVASGLNRIYKDRIESLVPVELKPSMRNTNRSLLFFEKKISRRNKAIITYEFIGEFRITQLTAVAGDKLNYGVYTKVADEIKVTEYC